MMSPCLSFSGFHEIENAESLSHIWPFQLADTRCFILQYRQSISNLFLRGPKAQQKPPGFRPLTSNNTSEIFEENAGSHYLSAFEFSWSQKERVSTAFIKDCNNLDRAPPYCPFITWHWENQEVKYAIETVQTLASQTWHVSVNLIPSRLERIPSPWVRYLHLACEEHLYHYLPTKIFPYIVSSSYQNVEPPPQRRAPFPLLYPPPVSCLREKYRLPRSHTRSLVSLGGRKIICARFGLHDMAEKARWGPGLRSEEMGWA